jgi:alcohol dehydrogenase, propanol-preferring
MASIRAAVVREPGPVAAGPRLSFERRPLPEPGRGQVRLRVRACAVCHTDLHVVEGELPPLGRPVVPGHQVVGTVDALGEGVDGAWLGRTVGVGWLGHTDGTCRYCARGQENLCLEARFTGYHLDGGYAEAMLADADFVHPLPTAVDPVATAPLLCAGAVGYRAFRLSGAGAGARLGLYGFGASAHLVLQVALRQGATVLAFTRGEEHRRLALELGAAWAGGAETTAPPGGPLDAAIMFAPAGGLVPLALRALGRGGTLVLAGIYMTPLPALPYDLLWQERVVRSVANGTRADARELLALVLPSDPGGSGSQPTLGGRSGVPSLGTPVAAAAPLKVEVEARPLAEANAALADLAAGRVRGAVVLRP